MTDERMPPLLDQLLGMVLACAYACASGSRTVTLTVRGIKPRGFPRCELLSEGTDGSRNYAADPVKVLSWLRDAVAKGAGNG